MSKTQLQIGRGRLEKSKELLFCCSLSIWINGGTIHYIRNTEAERVSRGNDHLFQGRAGFGVFL